MMFVGAALGATGSILWHFLLPPFLFVLGITLVCASFGKSLGVRKIYVKTLLKIFEMTRTITVEHKKNEKRKNSMNACFQVGEYSDSDSDLDLDVTSLPFESAAGKKNDNEDKEEDDDEKLSEAEDEVREMAEIAKRKQYLKEYGKKSVHNVISRQDNLILSPDKPATVPKKKRTFSTGTTKDWQAKILEGGSVSVETFRREYELDDILDYIKTGIASVIEDEVTQRFVAEELPTWNLLTRTSQSFEFINMKLTIIWMIGFFVRYCILLPGRTCILFVGILYLLISTTLIGMIPSARGRRLLYEYVVMVCFRILGRSFSALCWMGVCMFFVGRLPDGNFKKWLHYHVFTSCFQILGGALSAVITYHNVENKAPGSGICVANHTSPIDVLILACDNAYALIGQSHGGFIGLMQSILEKASDHIWFERAEYKDRVVVCQRLKEHVDDPTKLPILIFPEGTCINNTSVMQFKKGSFEVGGTIYPVAIKYDPKFGDAFWNSSKNGMLSYLFMMMTSWAIVCDVWYLPPETRRENESAVQFANRVKADIARKGGLVDLMWDGNLKRMEVKKEWKAKQQEEFSKRLKVD